MKPHLKIFTLLFLSIATIPFGVAASEQTSNKKLAVVVYPSLIYDSGKCSIYRNHLSKIMFIFFYRGKNKIKDLSAGSKLYVELPAGLELKYASLMDGWKKAGGNFSKFPVEKVTRDHQAYNRYLVPLPRGVNRPALQKPLPGGMFGGTPHNISNIYVKPKGNVPEKFKIYWEINGKYPVSGSFPAYLEELPVDTPNPARIKLRSFGPKANMGNPPEYIKDLGVIYKDVGIKWVDTQFASGPNEGYKNIWKKAGFKFYGGSNFLGTLMKYSLQDRTASENMNDYLVGLDGKRSFATDWRAYHARIWCPHAVVSPGRYPFKLNIEAARKEAKQGASELDADFEVHGWSHCFCSDCLKDFAEFSGVKYELLQNMKPVDIVKTYPLKWYKFRCSQTGKLYSLIRKFLTQNYPGVKIGCNTIILHPQNNLGDLKYGICDFAEDPRLLKDEVDYFLADTLTGSVYDAVAVDLMRKTTGKPVISVAGCSYCVGFSPHDMAFRRMTAELTGDKYGYARRTDFLKLGIVHQAASGAAGIRFSVEEVDAALKADQAAAILAKVEDWYLDGKRADDNLEVIDLTQSPSPWLQDKSRVGGGVWQSFYKQYCGRVQFRVHRKNEGILLSLFNWDPYQDKEWLLRLPKDSNCDYYITDIVNNRALCLNGREIWKAGKLRQGVPVKVPAAGMTILKLTTAKEKTSGQENIKTAFRDKMLAAVKDRTPYNQYGWYKGGQIDMKAYAARALKRPLEQLRKYGGKQKITNLSGNVSLPFSSDFSKVQHGMTIWSSRLKTDSGAVLSSDKKYCFAGIDFKSIAASLKLEMEFKCLDGAALGIINYEKVKTLKRISSLCWGKNAPDFTKATFILPLLEAKNRNCRVMFYNTTHKGSIIIKSLELKENKNDGKK